MVRSFATASRHRRTHVHCNTESMQNSWPCHVAMLWYSSASALPSAGTAGPGRQQTSRCPSVYKSCNVHTGQSLQVNGHRYTSRSNNSQQDFTCCCTRYAALCSMNISHSRCAASTVVCSTLNHTSAKACAHLSSFAPLPTRSTPLQTLLLHEVDRTSDMKSLCRSVQPAGVRHRHVHLHKFNHLQMRPGRPKSSEDNTPYARRHNHSKKNPTTFPSKHQLQKYLTPDSNWGNHHLHTALVQQHCRNWPTPRTHAHWQIPTASTPSAQLCSIATDTAC